MSNSLPNKQLEQARAAAVPPSMLAALEASGTQAYLVGGAVRDALGSAEPPQLDVDVAIDGDIDDLLAKLGVESRNHERFETAAVTLDGKAIDIARTRRETYAEPGALPEVEPAPIRTDLARRDFTVNAMAIPLLGEAELIDPYDGYADLQARTLRVIHADSFLDDPTRALRGARYAARLGFELDPETDALIRAADLSTVSTDRVAAELGRIAEEDMAVRAFELIDEWGLLAIGAERLALLREVAEYLLTDPWSRVVNRATVLGTIASGDAAVLRTARVLADQPGPGSGDVGPTASELYELASRHTDVELAIARGLGAEWLDLHVTEWRRVQLAIDGRALADAGVPEGPAVGAGLRAALHARIDGRVEGGADAELAVALAAAAEERDALA
jgi:tRNA nucleotidyltransferase (CCA-adding enzyme)